MVLLPQRSVQVRSTGTGVGLGVAVAVAVGVGLGVGVSVGVGLGVAVGVGVVVLPGATSLTIEKSLAKQGPLYQSSALNPMLTLVVPGATGTR
jgi:hypothetical protein